MGDRVGHNWLRWGEGLRLEKGKEKKGRTIVREKEGMRGGKKGKFRGARSWLTGHRGLGRAKVDYRWGEPGYAMINKSLKERNDNLEESHGKFCMPGVRGGYVGAEGVSS